MSLRTRTKQELGEIYIGFPDDIMGCDDEITPSMIQGWVPCVLPRPCLPSRSKCNYYGTEKCPHKQGDKRRK